MSDPSVSPTHARTTQASQLFRLGDTGPGRSLPAPGRWAHRNAQAQLYDRHAGPSHGHDPKAVAQGALLHRRHPQPGGRLDRGNETCGAHAPAFFPLRDDVVALLAVLFGAPLVAVRRSRLATLPAPAFRAAPPPAEGGCSSSTLRGWARSAAAA